MLLLFLYYFGAIVLGLFISIVGFLEKRISIIIIGFSICIILYVLSIFTLIGAFVGQNEITPIVLCNEMIALVLGFCIGALGIRIKQRVVKQILIVVGWSMFLSAFVLIFLLPYVVNMKN